MAPAAAVPAAAPVRAARTGRGYSRFVTVAKPVFAAAAAAVLAALALWPQFHNVPERFRLGAADFAGGGSGGHHVSNARFAGTDRNGNPYMLTAEGLTQRAEDGDVVRLRRPEADFTTADGAWVALSAPRGRFAPRRRAAALEGGVSLYHDAGYTLETESARVDFAEAAARSDAPVVVEGPAATLEAAGFRILREGSYIDFTGPARMVLRPRQAAVGR